MENYQNRANRRFLELDTKMDFCNRQLKEHGSILESIEKTLSEKMEGLNQRMDRLEDLFMLSISKNQVSVEIEEQNAFSSSSTNDVSLSTPSHVNLQYNEKQDSIVLHNLKPHVRYRKGECYMGEIWIN